MRQCGTKARTWISPYACSYVPKLPTVEPIVPTAQPLPFNNRAWFFEPKYDGSAGMLYLTHQSCTLYSKRGNRMTRFQELADYASLLTAMSLAGLAVLFGMRTASEVKPSWGSRSDRPRMRALC